MTLSDVAYSAFFYGTLLHPKILKRVIGNDGSHLQICPAVLLDHTRHKVKYADYPAMLPYTESHLLFGADLDYEQRSVRGSLVQGLTKADIDSLDVFEGNEYTRETVRVYPLEPLVPLNTIISPHIQVPSAAFPTSTIAPENPAPLPERAALASSIECQTYIWCNPIPDLEKELWSFAEFVKTNGWKWVGSGSDDNNDYKEVERRRQMEGNIVHDGA